mgnify:CR=1 FL=1
MNIIAIHIFPHEINEYDRIIKSLERNVSKLSNLINVEIRTCLNLNPSLLNEAYSAQFDYIISFFKKINKSSFLSIKEHITKSVNYLGVNDHRRYIIENADNIDNIFFLDCDLHFPDTTLYWHMKHIDKAKTQSEYYIITPQCVRLWDKTWDCLVSEKYIKKPIGFYKNADLSEIDNAIPSNVLLKKNNSFKWAGGWFNCISANLLKLTGIPNSFIGYGPDDTFVMRCCTYLKQKNIDVQQYILSELVVCEDKSLDDTPKLFKDNLPNFRKNSTYHLSEELAKFYQKL